MAQRARRLMMAAATLLAAIVTTTTAWADPAADLRDAHAQWTAAEFDTVDTLARRVLADASATAAQRTDALVLAAFVRVVDDDTPAAMALLDQACGVAPDYVLDPGYPSKFRAVYSAAAALCQVKQEQQLVRDLGPVLAQIHLRVQPPAHPRGGRTIPIEIDVVDPSHLGAEVVFAYRRRGEAGYVSKPYPVGTAPIHVQLPAEWTESHAPYAIEFHARLGHANGTILTRAGTAATPLDFTVAAGLRPLAWYKRWYVWAGAGAVAAAVGAVLYEARDVGPEHLVFR